MILWFGKKKKKEEALKAGAEMEAPELSAEDLAAKQAEEAEAARLAEEEAARKAAEQEEIERKVAEANRAWEERQKREAAEAEQEAARLAQEAADREAARRRAEADAEQARLQAEAEARAAAEAERQAEAERRAAEAEAKAAADAEEARKAADARAEAERLAREAEEKRRADAAAAEAARKAAEEQARLAAEADAARQAEEARRVQEEKAKAELALLEQRRADEALRQQLAEERAKREAERQAAIARGEPDPYAEVAQPGFFSKLSSGLAKSSSKMGNSITSLFTQRKLDDEALEDLEDILLTSDMGGKVSARIVQNLAKTRMDKDVTDEEIKIALADEIEAIMSPREEIVDFSEGSRPRVVLFVGVNGSGKTTTIGKIASKLQEQGAKALLVAGDTFRAAAIEQLTVWGERAGIPVLAKEPGADAAGLVYEAIEKAKAEDLDLVLVDTAGRLQNKAELMAELAKIVRVTRKLDPDAPHDVILVLDATVGQNALSQVEAFRHTADVTGIVMTKLDGTAKGGVLVAIAEAHALPIHFVGVGEKAEDLQPFSAQAYARALVGLADMPVEEPEPA
ncbi:MAG: signal recognition particle-docking protein FtsY [Pseudomonadota bacterium]|nr:signal recognition particle-docking protein FtsY [Pseudomonadota bacterium]